VFSPSSSAFYNDGPSGTPGCVTPNLLPHYQDALPHGGFNPNNLYSPAYEQREPVEYVRAGVRFGSVLSIVIRLLQRRPLRQSRVCDA
jgi:hypothetical protein